MKKTTLNDSSTINAYKILSLINMETILKHLIAEMKLEVNDSEDYIIGCQDEIDSWQMEIDELEPGYKYKTPDYRQSIKLEKKEIKHQNKIKKDCKEIIKLLQTTQTKLDKISDKI